ncbi:MAG TPA: helix-hairpin-helix domain-containing protein [Thermoplasmata archaeon]|nr:helix-hairpin-helix domain-containing protein [Thermoplasmata archaeon]
MTTNQELAEIFRSIADILDLQAERFKPEAYRRASRSIESLAEDIRRVAQRRELHQIPGVGAAIAEKIEEYLRDGKIGYYERLKAEVPAGVLEIMRLPGVGPKTARRFLGEFGIEGPAELATAIEAGRFQGVKGFGERKLELLKQALGAGQKGGRRRPLLEGWRIARRLVAAISAAAPVDRIEVAGSLRRRRESVGDLDILVTSNEPAQVLDAFGHLPDVTAVKLRGTTKETVLVEGELQVDLRVVEPEAFGAALQYFTGSKDHNVHLRTLARDRGLKINEYGVFRGDDRVAGRTEEDVYATLELPWIPAEMREDRGEIEAALAHRLPPIVGPSDIAGDFHVHLSPEGSTEEIDRRLGEAHAAGWTFLGFVLPEGDSLSQAALDHLRSRRAPSPGRASARVGCEVPLGAAPSSPDVDYVLHSARGVAQPPSGRLATTPFAVVHLALGSSGEEATPDTTRTWVDWAAAHAVGLEVSPFGAADGLDSAGVRAAAKAKVRVHLTAALRSPDDRLDALELSIGLARRGWLPPALALNGGLPAPTAPPVGRRTRS